MTVKKWTIRVNDQWQPIGAGKVILVACQRDADTVQVWTEESEDRGITPIRSALVIGTGMRVPADSAHIGSVVAAGGALVWHVYAGEVQ